jgi:hypothetical protein
MLDNTKDATTAIACQITLRGLLRLYTIHKVAIKNTEMAMARRWIPANSNTVPYCTLPGSGDVHMLRAIPCRRSGAHAVASKKKTDSAGMLDLSILYNVVRTS